MGGKAGLVGTYVTWKIDIPRKENPLAGVFSRLFPRTLRTMSAKFLEKILPKQVYTKLRQMTLFRPEDPSNLVQILPQKSVKGCGVERIQGFRFPAPGSVHTASIPLRDHVDKVYDIKAYVNHDLY